MPKPTRAHLAKLLLSDHSELKHKALIVWGPWLATDFPQVYQELVEDLWPLSLSVTQPQPIDVPESATWLLTCSYPEYCDSERASRNWMASATWRLLRELPREPVESILEDSRVALDLVQQVSVCRMVSEFEKLAIQDVLASRCPIGWTDHPETYLRKEKGLIDSVLERKAAVDRHVMFVWQFSNWYKQKTTRGWHEHYYIPWSEWGKAETLDKLFNRIYNMRPRRPLVLACGASCWLVHSHSGEQNSHRVFVCDNSALALCVWLQLVRTQYSGKDSFNAQIPC